VTIRSAASPSSAAEQVRPQEELRRGRRFLHLYLVLLALAIALFVALALLVRGEDRLLRYDQPIERAVQGVTMPGYGWLLTRVSDFGYPPFTYITYLAVFVTLILARRWPEAIIGVGSSLLAGYVSSALRQIIERPRPSDTLVNVAQLIVGPGFPSGHVTQYVTLFGFCFYLVLVGWHGGVPRRLLLALLALLIVLVGPSRIYLGAHWPSDTLGAYLFGGLWLAGTIEMHLVIERRLRARHRRRTEAGTPGLRGPQTAKPQP
jgi:undecaprenyl-diphosphatase